MNPIQNLTRTAAALGIAVSSLHAADGTWDANAAGNWDDIANWNAGVGPIADGAEFTATFDNVITADTTVTLVDVRTIGNITAADTSHNYTLSGNTLTLADADTPVIAVSNGSRTLTIGSVIDGSDGLKKIGAGTLTLNGSNIYTGGTTVDAGQIIAGHNSAFGADGITVTGNSSITVPYGSFRVISNNLQVDGGVTLTTVGSTQFFGMGFSGVVSGTGTIQTASSGNNANGGGNKLNLPNTANTFTGTLVNQGGSAIISANSLGDGGKIQLYANNNTNGGFAFHTGAIASHVFNTRQVELFGSSAVYNNAPTANTLTINTDLAIASTGNKTFYLRGGNTGDNTFGGVIADGNVSAAVQVISLGKYDAGKWILTGANTYTGNTIIANGTLEIRGAGQLGAGGIYPGNITRTATTSSPFVFDSSANTTISGTISGAMELVKDGAGTLTITGSAIQTGGTTVDAGTLSLGDGTNNANLNDFSTLSVAGGAVLNLNYSGSDAVFFLNLGGSPAAAGKWGRTGSIAGLGADFESALITGDGLINNVAGVTTSFGIAYWDGGLIDIVGDGNAASAGGAGTWDTTIQNWDVGFTAHSAWLNTTSSKAVFAGAENANRTVTVTEPLNIKELSFETTGSSGTRYIIDGGTLNFGAGGMIRTADNRYDQTITSIITGEPAVQTRDFGAGNTYKGLIFAPSSGTQALGAVLNPNNTGTTDKAGVTFAGSTTGNTVASIDYAGSDRFADTNFQGGEWTVAGIVRTGTLRISGGRAIINGNTTLEYNGLVMSGTGVLGGTTTVFKNDRRSTNNFPSGTGIAPGDGIGTITFDWGTAGGPNADQWITAFRAGSFYEWEVGAANATDVVHVVDGRLIVEGITLKIIDSGGAPAPADQLPVFTYGTLDLKTLDLASVVIDATGAPDWDASGATLVDDGAGTIYLTGLSSSASTPYDDWAAGFLPADVSDSTGDDDSDGLSNLLEFAFGTDPTVSDAGSLTWDGTNFTAGSPVVDVDFPGVGVDFTARFIRRTDHGTSGSAAYAWQFSSDLSDWESSDDAPAPDWFIAPDVLATDGDYQLVEVPYPLFLDNGKKARFFRVAVSIVP